MFTSLMLLFLALPPTKVDVCHRAGGPRWQALSVSENAVKAHVGHGDFLVTPAKPCPPVGALDEQVVVVSVPPTQVGRKPVHPGSPPPIEARPSAGTFSVPPAVLIKSCRVFPDAIDGDLWAFTNVDRVDGHVVVDWIGEHGSMHTKLEITARQKVRLETGSLGVFDGYARVAAYGADIRTVLDGREGREYGMECVR